MPDKSFKTVRELLYYSYANLGMAHAAVKEDAISYNSKHYMIRQRMLDGFKSGNMDKRSFIDDEKVKMELGTTCNVCGLKESFTIEHIFPRNSEGPDDANNLIAMCQTCNSSKGKKDLMEWMRYKGEFLPLMVIRRYMKLVIEYCKDHDLLDLSPEEIKNQKLPFKIDSIPLKYPSPIKLKIVSTDITRTNSQMELDF